MDAEEREIYEYLKSWPKEFTSAREICLRAGGKHRYRGDSRWALPVLTRMVEAGLLDVDSRDRYRLRTPEQRAAKPRRWVAPHIARILQQSGKNFGDLDVIGMDKRDDH